MATLEGHELYGKTVVDVTNGESVGSVADILVDSAEGRVAGRFGEDVVVVPDGAVTERRP